LQDDVQKTIGKETLLPESIPDHIKDISNFDKNMVMKHDPRHDVCYDVFMLLHGT
jgi:hypothetical protein